MTNSKKLKFSKFDLVYFLGFIVCGLIFGFIFEDGIGVFSTLNVAMDLF